VANKKINLKLIDRSLFGRYLPIPRPYMSVQFTGKNGKRIAVALNTASETRAVTSRGSWIEAIIDGKPFPISKNDWVIVAEEGGISILDDLAFNEVFMKVAPKQGRQLKMETKLYYDNII